MGLSGQRPPAPVTQPVLPALLPLVPLHGNVGLVPGLEGKLLAAPPHTCCARSLASGLPPHSHQHGGLAGSSPSQPSIPPTHPLVPGLSQVGVLGNPRAPPWHPQGAPSPSAPHPCSPLLPPYLAGSLSQRLVPLRLPCPAALTPSGPQGGHIPPRYAPAAAFVPGPRLRRRPATRPHSRPHSRVHRQSPIAQPTWSRGAGPGRAARRRRAGPGPPWGGGRGGLGPSTLHSRLPELAAHRPSVCTRPREAPRK